MSEPWISYNDSEIRVYHPICKIALNNALVKLHLSDKYQVLHHQLIGSLEMDFAIQNIHTKKYLCVVEVKRTPEDIHSARFQYQAMSYVQLASAELERPFYILTNLEYAFTFRYDGERPRVVQQMLKPGLVNISSFSTEEEEFINKLSEYFLEVLSKFLLDEYEYLVTLDQFAKHMELIKSDKRRWKSSLAILLYEYIRGAFNSVRRSDLPHDVRIFHNNIFSICNEAVKVNFRDIFQYDETRFVPTIEVPNEMLSGVYDFGEQNISGDSIADILHQIVTKDHEHDGEVPTDPELSRVVSLLAKNIHGPLDKDKKICDPAAGSGNLISSAIETFSLNSNQIKANDVNHQLIELLSLRLGLRFVKTVSAKNSPNISASNIVDIEPKYFDDIEIIIMNPPFSAGINCVDRKSVFFPKIKGLKHQKPATQTGQMPLEGVFLELVCSLAKPGTIIVCIFPKTHIIARGEDAHVIRKLLLEDFGLQMIFSYPGDNLFEAVVKDTLIFVGKIKQPADKIRIISSYEDIPDLDLNRFTQAIESELSKEFSQIMPGIQAKFTDKIELENTIKDGWRETNSEMVEAILFIRENVELNESFIKLKNLEINVKRGSVGNLGGSDLLFTHPTPEELALGLRVKPGMRNAKFDSAIVGNGDAQFFDISINKINLVDYKIKQFMENYRASGRQQRKQKTAQEWKDILQREAEGEFKEDSILIPRAIRAVGKVYYTNLPTFVSTNFFVYTPEDKQLSVILASWMNTIFYQLNCEVSSKDQEGVRKMESSDIGETFIPSINLNNDQIINLENMLNELSFLELKTPNIRPIDQFWSQLLFGDNGTKMLEQAQRLLAYLANKRNPT